MARKKNANQRAGAHQQAQQPQQQQNVCVCRVLTVQPFLFY